MECSPTPRACALALTLLLGLTITACSNDDTPTETTGRSGSERDSSTTTEDDESSFDGGSSASDDVGSTDDTSDDVDVNSDNTHDSDDTDSGEFGVVDDGETGAGEAAVSFPVTFRVSSVDDLVQLQGQPQWLDAEYGRVVDAVWTFEDDGSFVFTTSDVRDDLYPLYGTSTLTGTTLSFEASNSSANAGGSAYVEMLGEIDLSGVAPQVSFDWLTTSGMGAVVNDQTFASSTASEYQVVATLEAG